MKCPNCGWSPKDVEKMDFTKFMDLTIKRVSEKQKKEFGYGIPESNQKESSKKRKKAR